MNYKLQSFRWSMSARRVRWNFQLRITLKSIKIVRTARFSIGNLFNASNKIQFKISSVEYGLVPHFPSADYILFIIFFFSCRKRFIGTPAWTTMQIRRQRWLMTCVARFTIQNNYRHVFFWPAFIHWTSIVRGVHSSVVLRNISIPRFAICTSAIRIKFFRG